jgi:uncharacterized Zn finger protein
MAEEHSPLESLLSGLNRDQLQSLVLKLAEQKPSLTETIKIQATLLQTPASKPDVAPKPLIQIDPKQIRRQVYSTIHSLDRMRSSEAYWHVGAVVNEVGQILDQAWTFIEADDGRNALVVLQAITEEYLSEWENLDDSDGESSDFFNELGPVWVEALLSTDLTDNERKTWADRLDTWQGEVSSYGVDEAFDAAAVAALDGWDYPPLQHILQGTITEHEAEEDEEDEEDEASHFADDITKARLNILERRRRFQEYLHLAKAEGQTQRYATMLIHLNRAQEAIAYGLKYLRTTEDALALAKALYEHGESEQSLQIAERGLTLEGHKATLAKWLRDQAEAMDKMDVALTAAEHAFREEISLANYQQVAALAGEQWTEKRTALLDYIRNKKSYNQHGSVEVFLHEELLDDAIAALEPYATHTLVEQVADSALKSQSQLDWVIQASRKQAEYIMDGGKADHYYSAGKWLAKARTAYQASGRNGEWQVYLNGLLSTHGRKYKLVPILKGLR